MGQLEYCILSIKVIFGLNFISKQNPAVFVKMYLFLKLCPFPLCMKFYISKYKLIYLFQYSIIYYNFTSDWNLSLNAFTLDTGGDVFILDSYVVLCRIPQCARKTIYSLLHFTGSLNGSYRVQKIMRSRFHEGSSSTSHPRPPVIILTQVSVEPPLYIQKYVISKNP